MGEIDQVKPFQRCSACKKEVPREQFSKKQRKKSGNRRCSNCVTYGIYDMDLGLSPAKNRIRTYSKGAYNKGASKNSAPGSVRFRSSGGKVGGGR